MKNVTRSTASLNAEEIITNNIILDGYEIDYSILPKLVHRTSLVPEITVDGVDERQYYTLHNDAGVCVYVSPSLSEYMYRRMWWWRPWKPGPRRRNKWQFLPIVLPPHPGGKVPTGRPKPKPEKVTDISWKYYCSNQKSAPASNRRDWKPSEVERAVSAWEQSEIEKFSMQMPNVEDCTRMFYGCKKLRGFYSSNFQKCTDATGMFEGCIKLKDMTLHPGVFRRVQYTPKMFMGSGVRQVELYMPEMFLGNSMFEDCPNLVRARMVITKCEDMNRMFAGCRKLAEVRFPRNEMSSTVNHLPNVMTANAAFAVCPISDFQVTHMPKLEWANEMFTYTNLYQIQTCFPELTEANSMYEGCSDLRYFSIDANSDELLAKFPKLQTARFMFNGCKNFETTDFKADSFPELLDGFAMFQRCSKLTTIPCSFPKLQNARQMFMNCNISGEFDLDMPKDFPNVSVNSLGGGNAPTAYMFTGNPITSLSFDVSSVDNGMSMFANCPTLTQCTKAIFQEGGSYQSMFGESNFDAASGSIIITAAINANVQILHIGMNSNARTEQFRNTFGLVQVTEGSDSQWKTEDGKIIIVWH